MWLLWIGLAVCTASRVTVWQSNVTLWQDAVAGAPCEIRPHLELAFAYGDHGDGDDAEAEWMIVSRLANLAVVPPRWGTWMMPDHTEAPAARPVLIQGVPCHR